MFVFQFVIKTKKDVQAGSLEEFYNAKGRHPRLVQDLHRMHITNTEMTILENSYKQIRKNGAPVEDAIDWIAQTVANDKKIFDVIWSAFGTHDHQDCLLRKFRLNAKEIVALFEIDQQLSRSGWEENSKEYQNARKEHTQMRYIFESIKQAKQNVGGQEYYQAYPYGNHAVFYEMALDILNSALGQKIAQRLIEQIIKE